MATEGKNPSTPSLIELLATLEPIEDELLPIDDPPPEPVELNFDLDPETDSCFEQLIRLLRSR